MNIADYDYNLIQDSIAIHPPKERGRSKLLVLDRETGKITDSMYFELDKFLQPGDLVLINETKVVPARLFARKGEQLIELLFLEKHGDDTEPGKRKAIYRGKLDQNDELLLDVRGGDLDHAYIAETNLIVEEILGEGIALIRAKMAIDSLLDKYGEVPIPPYLKRDANLSDRERYQTEFARVSGSVAAPTASLNFTVELADKLRAKGVKIEKLTLHVGSGTFLPIRVEDISQHKMHEEYYEISSTTVAEIRAAKKEGRKVVAIGTTVTRALEHAADKINLNWLAGDITGEADIFIYPGYEFKIVDRLLTNFHAPRSTVLMLAAAFAKPENLFAAYDHALANGYKFLSYGDSMLIL